MNSKKWEKATTISSTIFLGGIQTTNKKERSQVKKKSKKLVACTLVRANQKTSFDNHIQRATLLKCSDHFITAFSS